MLNRRGATVAEILVALTLASIVLGSMMSSVLRQQRSHARASDVSGAEAQSRAATRLLASQLASLEPAAGDITPASATDTSIQYRAAVALGIACNASPGLVIPVPSGSGGLDGSFSTVRGGDSLWWFVDSLWHAAPIAEVSAIAAQCTLPMPAAGASVRLSIGAHDTVPPGAPLRVTRQTRSHVYRSGDGTWQLGFREWNPVTQSFTAPQPVAGPLIRRSGDHRSGFRYYDQTDAELLASAGSIDVTRIARIRILASSRVVVRDPSQDSVRTDSVDIALRPAATP